MIHASVRPNRATRFMRHVSCVGKVLAADVTRCHGSIASVPRQGVSVETVEAEWAAVVGSLEL